MVTNAWYFSSGDCTSEGVVDKAGSLQTVEGSEEGQTLMVVGEA